MHSKAGIYTLQWKYYSVLLLVPYCYIKLSDTIDTSYKNDWKITLWGGVYMCTMKIIASMKMKDFTNVRCGGQTVIIGQL